MRIALQLMLFALAAMGPAASWGDVIPPQIAQAQERLRANPNLFDRHDSFCTGKRPGDACSIPGSTLAGGGPGQCRSLIESQQGTIDLTCMRDGDVKIDRGLPSGGFVNDEHLCRYKASARDPETRKLLEQFNCTPLPTVPADRFCTGKPLGSACTVELSYRDRTERNEGVCKQLTETERFYFQGRRVAKREVIRCEPEQTAARDYAPVNWLRKLAQ